MAKGFDQRLAELQGAVKDPREPKARARVIQALDGKSGMLVAVASEAVLAGEDEDDLRVDRELLARLPVAFERLMHDAVQRDPQCRGKVAIVKTLRRAEAQGDEVFLSGVRHVQNEPVWGGRVDTAAELRGVCVMALIEGHHPRAMVEAAHLLADPQAAARTAAARALGCSGRVEVAEALLRLRVQAGEEESEVLGECFGGLLQLAPEPSVDYVAGFLGTPEEAVAEAAALALGESRLAGALAPLIEQAGRSVGKGVRRVVLLAIALLRSEEAWSYLVAQVEQGPVSTAAEALEALAAFRHDERLLARVQAAVQERGVATLVRAFDERFAS